jgi:hypothetical protein
MAGYVDPPEPVADSGFSPLEDAADHFLTPCRHSPGSCHPQPPRCDFLAERPLQCFFTSMEYSVLW